VSRTISFERYPGLSPLFLEFLRGLPDFYPDLPSVEAAISRGRGLLGTRSKIAADAFRYRRLEAAAMAEELSAGRAVAVLVGHQVGLFTGPLFTVTKAFDAIRVARELKEAGVPAVPVFWALTDDHDLEEIARTARPADDGPQILVLEGADRTSRQPVGGLPLPAGVGGVLDAFRADARGPWAEEILQAFARRYSPGASYGDAFIEMLFDLVDPEPLLVLDPCAEKVRGPASEFFLAAVEREKQVRETLRQTADRLEREGKAVPVPFREGLFPFFTIDQGERRRIEDLSAAAARVSRKESWPSTDVLTRPVLKSWLMPVAASILGAAEIAYHAQALALFPVFGLPLPVLLPRSHLVLLGPRERRAAEALAVGPEDLLSLPARAGPEKTPETEEVSRIASALDAGLAALEPRLADLDATLSASLENVRRKIAHQLEQLSDRIRKAAERKDEIAWKRRRLLETMLLPQGTPAERLYPPLVWMLAYGRDALAAVRQAARGSTHGAAIVDLASESQARPDPKERSHAG